MNCDYVLQYLEKTEVPIVSKKNHDIIMCGLEKMIFLKEGVVKVSSILEDGREYNITYAKGPPGKHPLILQESLQEPLQNLQKCRKN